MRRRAKREVGGILNWLIRSRSWKTVYATAVKGRLLESSEILNTLIPHLMQVSDAFGLKGSE